MPSIYVFSYYYLCVRILLYLCPHANMYVFSYYSRVADDACLRPHTTICVLILHVFAYYMCVFILLCVSSYYYVRLLILLHVSAYYYTWPLYVAS